MRKSNTVKLPNKLPTIKVTPMPADTNAGGSIFGGWIMSQVDIAGSIAAVERAKGRVVTVSVNSFEFHEPVFVGDLISCFTDVINVGRTSIKVKVEVFAQRNPVNPQTVKVTEAVLTYVAIDENRRPRVVPTESD